jgi:hypothetical protein
MNISLQGFIFQKLNPESQEALDKLLATSVLTQLGEMQYP